MQHNGTYRDARVSPGNVTTGVPVHKTSIDVVWPLHNGVSKHTSANWPRRTCSSFAATFENMMRPPGRPTHTRNQMKINSNQISMKCSSHDSFIKFSIDRPTQILCGLLKIWLTNGWETEQPEDCIGDILQNCHPRFQSQRINFVQLIEIAVDDCAVG